MTDVSVEVASRLAFSYGSMMHTSEWLIWKEHDETVDLGKWNAYVDSFLVHARRLHDVLADNKKNDDDLVLSDLLDDPPHIALPRTGEFRNRMNKRVLHLTTHAEPEAVGWPVASIAKELGQAMDSVIEAMRTCGSDYYERFRDARDEKPGFRKLIM